MLNAIKTAATGIAFAIGMTIAIIATGGLVFLAMLAFQDNA